MQVSQETGQVVWYSNLFENFPVCCDPHKGFSVANEAEVDVFLEFPCFLYDPTDVCNLISGSSAFSKSSCLYYECKGQSVGTEVPQGLSSGRSMLHVLSHMLKKTPNYTRT